MIQDPLHFLKYTALNLPQFEGRAVETTIVPKPKGTKLAWSTVKLVGSGETAVELPLSTAESLLLQGA